MYGFRLSKKSLIINQYCTSLGFYLLLEAFPEKRQVRETGPARKDKHIRTNADLSDEFQIVN